MPDFGLYVLCSSLGQTCSSSAVPGSKAQSVEAVIQSEQSMPSKRNHHRFFIFAEKG